MVLKLDDKRFVEITDEEFEIIKMSVHYLRSVESRNNNNSDMIDKIDLVRLKLAEIKNKDVRKLFENLN